MSQLDPKHAAIHEPPPQQGGGKKVLDFAIADLVERAEAGKKKYGTYLETSNGRNALNDAYQEALDLVMYLKQQLLEQETQIVEERHNERTNHGLPRVKRRSSTHRRSAAHHRRR